MSTIAVQAAAFKRSLMTWYQREQRKLPWRTTPSLYRTVVSEFMLQQTQVKTVLPYFERWLARFPDFKHLADASADDVLKHWEGLGYYSRARNLHKLAQAYVALEKKPNTAEEWKVLPGIGSYTSAAISSIAQGYPAAVVDGNVVRILARLTLDQRTFKSNGEAVKAFTKAADSVLDTENPGDHNQAMMELGATVCLKRKPLCTVCPVVRFCAAAAQGEPEALPRIQRKATERDEVDRLWILDEGKLLLHRTPDDAPQLAGQFELPSTEHLATKPATGKVLATKMRSITHRRIKERILAPRPQAGILKKLSKNKELFWIELEKLNAITLSGPHRRWVKELLKETRRAQ